MDLKFIDFVIFLEKLQETSSYLLKNNILLDFLIDLEKKKINYLSLKFILNIFSNDIFHSFGFYLGLNTLTLNSLDFKINNEIEKSDLLILELIESLKKISILKGTGSKIKKINLLKEILEKLSTKEIYYFLKILRNNLNVGVNEIRIKKLIFELLKKEYKLIENYDYYNSLCYMPFSLYYFIKTGERELFSPITNSLCCILEKKELEEINLKEYYVEPKYDGIRVQIHFLNEKVIIYTRAYEDLTPKLPKEFIENLKKELIKNGREYILDGELCLSKKNFISTDLMKFRRIYEKEKGEDLKIILFDILSFNNTLLIKESLKKRRDILENIFFEEVFKIVDKKEFDTKEDFLKYYKEEIEPFKIEGVILKNKLNPFISGRKVGNWYKYKDYKNTTLDLLCVGGLFGSYKYENIISSFLLCYKNSKTNNLKPISYTGTGFSKEVYDYLNNYFIKEKKEKLSYLIEDSSFKVDYYFENPLIFEIAFQNISLSKSSNALDEILFLKNSEYKGVSLRFPSFIKIRTDKKIEEISNSEEILKIYNLEKNY